MHGGKFKQSNGADFAGNGCLKFGFLVAIRKTRRTNNYSTTYILSWPGEWQNLKARDGILM